MILQNEELALDRPDCRFGYIAIANGELRSVVCDVSKYGTQVLEIEDEKPLLVSDPKTDIQHAFLNVVEIHEPREQQRSHLRDGGANGMALLTK